MDLPENPDLIMTPQAAEVIGVSRQGLHKMLQHLPGTTRIGTFPLYLRREVEAYAAERKGAQAKDTPEKD
jgi:predicted DNA-binding transcriptional regulator AlpA